MFHSLLPRPFQASLHFMKAIRVEEHGGPEVLKLLDVAPIEAPGPGQAVVRVAAAGVNFLDVGQRRGTYPSQVPFTVGVEGAGVVESVGEGVRNVNPLRSSGVYGDTGRVRGSHPGRSRAPHPSTGRL